MPRLARKSSLSCFYHVMVQGLNKEAIFNNPKNLSVYKSIIKQKIEESKVTIIAYCLMNNHAHFLIYSDRCEYLSKFMQKVNVAYSNYYNKENDRVGFVFRDRYLSQEITSIKQLYNCMVYIHRNPVAAGIVDNYKDYRFSSYNEFLGPKEIISNEAIKLVFGSKSNYLEQFNYFHNKKQEEEFIELKDKKISSLIKETEIKYGKEISDIILHRELLKEIVKQARIETSASLKELADALKVPVSTIWRCCK